MSKRVYKYATGVEIPEGAQYLSTQVETETFAEGYDGVLSGNTRTFNLLVWHYFLVETTPSDLEHRELPASESSENGGTKGGN